MDINNCLLLASKLISLLGLLEDRCHFHELANLATYIDDAGNTQAVLGNMLIGLKSNSFSPKPYLLLRLLSLPDVSSKWKPADNSIAGRLLACCVKEYISEHPQSSPKIIAVKMTTNGMWLRFEAVLVAIELLSLGDHPLVLNELQTTFNCWADHVSADILKHKMTISHIWNAQIRVIVLICIYFWKQNQSSIGIGGVGKISCPLVELVPTLVRLSLKLPRSKGHCLLANEVRTCCISQNGDYLSLPSNCDIFAKDLPNIWCSKPEGFKVDSVCSLVRMALELSSLFSVFTNGIDGTESCETESEREYRRLPWEAHHWLSLLRRVEGAIGMNPEFSSRMDKNDVPAVMRIAIMVSRHLSPSNHLFGDLTRGVSFISCLDREAPVTTQVVSRAWLSLVIDISQLNLKSWDLSLELVMEHLLTSNLDVSIDLALLIHHKLLSKPSCLNWQDASMVLFVLHCSSPMLLSFSVNRHTERYSLSSSGVVECLDHSISYHQQSSLLPSESLMSEYLSALFLSVTLNVQTTSDKHNAFDKAAIVIWQILTLNGNETGSGEDQSVRKGKLSAQLISMSLKWITEMSRISLPFSSSIDVQTTIHAIPIIQKTKHLIKSEGVRSMEMIQELRGSFGVMVLSVIYVSHGDARSNILESLSCGCLSGSQSSKLNFVFALSKLVELTLNSDWAKRRENECDVFMTSRLTAYLIPQLPLMLPAVATIVVDIFQMLLLSLVGSSPTSATSALGALLNVARKTSISHHLHLATLSNHLIKVLLSCIADSPYGFNDIRTGAYSIISFVIARNNEASKDLINYLLRHQGSCAHLPRLESNSTLFVQSLIREKLLKHLYLIEQDHNQCSLVPYVQFNPSFCCKKLGESHQQCCRNNGDALSSPIWIQSEDFPFYLKASWLSAAMCPSPRICSSPMELKEGCIPSVDAALYIVLSAGDALVSTDTSTLIPWVFHDTDDDDQFTTSRLGRARWWGAVEGFVETTSLSAVVRWLSQGSPLDCNGNSAQSRNANLVDLSLESERSNKLQSSKFNDEQEMRVKSPQDIFEETQHWVRGNISIIGIEEFEILSSRTDALKPPDLVRLDSLCSILDSIIEILLIPLWASVMDGSKLHQVQRKDVLSACSEVGSIRFAVALMLSKRRSSLEDESAIEMSPQSSLVYLSCLTDELEDLFEERSNLESRWRCGYRGPFHWEQVYLAVNSSRILLKSFQRQSLSSLQIAVAVVFRLYRLLLSPLCRDSSSQPPSAKPRDRTSNDSLFCDHSHQVESVSNLWWVRCPPRWRKLIATSNVYSLLSSHSVVPNYVGFIPDHESTQFEAMECLLLSFIVEFEKNDAVSVSMLTPHRTGDQRLQCILCDKTSFSIDDFSNCWRSAITPIPVEALNVRNKSHMSLTKLTTPKTKKKITPILVGPTSCSTSSATVVPSSPLFPIRLPNQPGPSSVLARNEMFTNTWSLLEYILEVFAVSLEGRGLQLTTCQRYLGIMESLTFRFKNLQTDGFTSQKSLVHVKSCVRLIGIVSKVAITQPVLIKQILFLAFALVQEEISLKLLGSVVLSCATRIARWNASSGGWAHSAELESFRGKPGANDNEATTRDNDDNDDDSDDNEDADDEMEDKRQKKQKVAHDRVLQYAMKHLVETYCEDAQLPELSTQEEDNISSDLTLNREGAWYRWKIKFLADCGLKEVEQDTEDAQNQGPPLLFPTISVWSTSVAVAMEEFHRVLEVCPLVSSSQWSVVLFSFEVLITELLILRPDFNVKNRLKSTFRMAFRCIEMILTACRRAVQELKSCISQQGSMDHGCTALLSSVMTVSSLVTGNTNELALDSLARRKRKAPEVKDKAHFKTVFFWEEFLLHHQGANRCAQILCQSQQLLIDLVNLHQKENSHLVEEIEQFVSLAKSVDMSDSTIAAVPPHHHGLETKKRTKHRHLRSRNSVIDEWLQDESDDDAYADLEGFIVEDG